MNEYEKQLLIANIKESLISKEELLETLEEIEDALYY